VAIPEPPPAETSAPLPESPQTLRLGEILIARGLVDPEELERALELQRERGDKIGKILVDMGFIALREVLAALSEQLNVPLATLDTPPPAAPEIEALSPRFMRQYRFVPLALDDSTLTIAMADPLDFETIAAVRSFSGLKVQTALASEQEVLDALNKHYGQTEKAALDCDFDAAEASEDLEHLRDMASEAPVIRLVNAMIAEALEKRSSDIHIEPFEKEFRIRFRIDGVLYNQETPPRELKAAIISRLKLMAKLNIAERRLPQDGRIKIKILGREVDLRVSTLPTLYGESVVMRLLDRSAGDFYDLRRLGFDNQMLARMEHFTSLPHGMFLVTGPTGSGKSTTLYSALKRINLPDKKIITIEDPVEYQMDGINQLHVNPQIGLTFASGLRHIVRQDPDVIMVGEIRDRETADIAIRAALTGHLVFSTLHTNDAPSAITRLTDMGVENYLITSSLVAVLAQRLVRVICAHCKVSDGMKISPEGESIPSFRGTGCSHCSGNGYTSRVGIFELMDLNDEIRQRIMANEDAAQLTLAARRNGMRTLAEDGWRLVRDGATTPEEVLRVTPNDAESYWGMGQAYTRNGDDPKALNFYKDAVRLDPAFGKGQAELGKTLVRLFQYNEAIGPLKEGIRLKPKAELDHADYYSLGEAYLRTRQYQEAIAAYRQARELLRGHVWTEVGLAESYNGLKQYENAIASATQALKLQPYDYRSNRAMGDSYSGMGQYEKAVEYYKESIRVSSHRAQVDALLALGLTYNRMGRHEEAIGVFEKGIQYASTPKQFQIESGTDPVLLASLYFSTAEANLNLGRGDVAAQAAGKYIELQSWSDSNAPYAALMSYFGNRKAGRDEEAKRVLTEAVARTDAKSWPASIIKYLRDDLKEKDLLALATDNDRMTEARAYVGMALALEKRHDAARAHLEWVVKNGNRDFIEYTLAKAELKRITSP
jgi:general secretion pathway protein E